MTLSILAVRRARRLSPGHVSDDWLILKETADRLAALGHDVRFLEEERVGETLPPADVVLNMCQGPEANGRLCAAEGNGVLFINRPSAALDCLRYRLLPKLRQGGVPMPESVVVGASDGPPCRPWPATWLKRVDVHATGPDDVVKAGSEDEARGVLAAFRARGLPGAIAQEHLPGPVVKFYAVGAGFFHHKVTSGPADVELDLALLRRRAQQCGDVLGLDVFGGECVATADGRLPVIDVNDWPSFAPCRAAAARAIASHVLAKAEVAA
jgi:hypothetical protein